MSSSPTETHAEAIDIVMPQMGVSVAEGTVAGWLKEPGETVAAGRRRMVPPGVPDPDVWGEREGEPASPEEVAASVQGGRVRRRR